MCSSRRDPRSHCTLVRWRKGKRTITATGLSPVLTTDKEAIRES
jgi:hypothetical protein